MQYLTAFNLIHQCFALIKTKAHFCAICGLIKVAGVNLNTWGGFHKPIYALRQALTLCAELLRPKKASQKFGAEHKMAFRPTSSLYEIDPWKHTVFHSILKI